jgi:hypothetical protein
MAGAPFTFEEQVFQAELEEIRRRLRPPTGVAPSDKPLPPEGSDVRPSAAHGLVGLSFSGGGIRSATFNLGVLQALHRHGVLPHVDYLSTVSGGGYVGGAMSSLMQGAGDPFPFVLEDKTPEAPATVHLRNNANYLAPGGAPDFLTLGMVVGRGIAVNLLLIAPALLLLALLASLSLDHQLWHVGEGDLTQAIWLTVRDLHSFRLTPWAALLAGVWLALSPIATRLVSWHANRRASSSDEGYRQRMWLYRSYALVVALAWLVAFIEVQPLLVVGFHRLFVPDSLMQRLFSMVGSGALSLGAGLYLQRSTAGQDGQQLLSKLGTIAVSLLGPLLPTLLYLYAADLIVYTQPGRADFPVWSYGLLPADDRLLRLAPEAFTVLLVFATWFYARLFIDVNEHSGHGFWRDRLSKAYLIRPSAKGGVTQNDGLRWTELAAPGSSAPYHLVNTTVNLQGSPEESASGRSSDFYLFSKRFVGSPKLGFAPTEAVERVLPHINLGTGVAISSAAAAPNMGAYTVSSVRMLLTLLNVRMNYWAPHPGRFCETYALDATPGRLSAWMEQMASSSPVRNGREAARWRPGVFELYRELFGRVDARGALVNLSDGGHLENLGAYELLRRRCKFLIVCDAEADPLMQFGAMSALSRFVRVDLGVEIEIDLDGLRRQASGFSHRQAAMGVVRYPKRGSMPAETGLLLYIKSSMVGTEHILLRQYHDAHPSFPHESTADQFFSEEQFEAYRALGYGIVDGILSDAMRRPRVTNPNMERSEKLSFAGFTAVMDTLRVQLAPALPADVDAFVQLQSELMQVDASVSEDASAVYLDQYPELRASQGEPGTAVPEEPEARQRMLSAINGQLQLMENTFLALNLSDARRRDHEINAGWMNVFRRWSASPLFRWGYTVSAAMYGSSFRVFCANSLGLVLSVAWRAVDYTELKATGMVTAEDEERLRAAVRGVARYELLIASRQVAGAASGPEASFGWVALIERGEEWHLGPHGLRAGDDGVASYTFLLRGLTSLVDGGATLTRAGEILSFGDDEPGGTTRRRLARPAREDLLLRYSAQIDMGSLSGPAEAASQRTGPAAEGSRGGPRTPEVRAPDAR